MEMSLEQWLNMNTPKEHKKLFESQISFIRDALPKALIDDFHKKSLIKTFHVVSTHTSLGTTLPIVELCLTDESVFTIMGTLDDEWIVSMSSETRFIQFYMNKIVEQGKSISPEKYPGFPKEKLFESPLNCNHRFTVEVKSRYDLYTLIWNMFHIK